jgi:hypothetical protein
MLKLKHIIIPVLLLLTSCYIAESNSEEILHLDTSIFVSRPPDPRALDASSFGVIGDGITDDTVALQRAINATYSSSLPDCSLPGARIVMLEGNGKRYRVTDSLLIWIWVRLIGFGLTRPILILTPSSSRFSNISNLHPMIRITDATPAAPTCQINTADGGNTAFGCGVINIDINIGMNNPGAVGIRNRAAQGGVLRAMRFDLADNVASGVHSPGWGLSDLHFVGGSTGVLIYDTGAWPFIIRDSVFEHQSVAGIAWDHVSTDSNPHSAWEGVTIVRGNFTDSLAAVDASGVLSSRITIINSTFARIAVAVVLPPMLAEGNSSIIITESGGIECAFLLGVSDAADAVPSPGGSRGAFKITKLVAGLASDNAREPNGTTLIIRVKADASAVASIPPLSPRDTPTYPPIANWISVTDYGVKGDGITDNAVTLSALFLAAPNGSSFFFPMGVYLSSVTLQINSNTYIFGLSCWDVVLSLTDTAPGFSDPSQLKPFLFVSGMHGSSVWISGLNIRSGITFGVPQALPVPMGWFNPNPGALALLWRAESGGLLDVFFHPPSFPDNRRLGTGPNTELSLVVANGGGGVFADIWSCNSYSMGGARVYTTTSRVLFYQLSSEHHAGHELWVTNATNVIVHTMQTEDRSPDAAPTASVIVESGSSVLVTGLFSYYAANISSAGAIIVDSTSMAHIQVFRQYHSYHPEYYNCSILALSTNGDNVCVTDVDFADVSVGRR